MNLSRRIIKILRDNIGKIIFLETDVNANIPDVNR